MKTLATSVVALCALAGAAHGQFVNGDFETGDFTGWTITPTTNGTTAVQAVELFDIDGPGPLTDSLAGKFSVGMAVFQSGGRGGVELTQPLQLMAGTQYTFEFDYAAFGPPPRTVGNAEGGLFELIVDGAVLASGAIEGINPNTWYGGHVATNYVPNNTGSYNVGVRITRRYTVPSPQTSPLFQYVDNFQPGEAPCYPDCDTSTGVGVLDIFDFLCFQNRYDAGSPYACDCDTSTGVGVCDIFDFLCFQNAFEAGCP